MYLLKWFLKRLTKIYNGILGRINFKWTPVIVNFFWLLKKVSFSLLTTTLYVCTLVLLRKNVVCKHIYEYQRIYIFFGCFHKYTTSNRLSHHCLQYIYIGPSNYIVYTRSSRWRQCPPDLQLWRLPHNDGILLYYLPKCTLTLT